MEGELPKCRSPALSRSPVTAGSSGVRLDRIAGEDAIRQLCELALRIDEAPTDHISAATGQWLQLSPI